MDSFAFGDVPLSRLLYRMANYYLLEPERVHVCTMCAKELSLPVSVTRYAHLFDLKDSGDDFYFDNVTAYVHRVMDDIEKLDFNSTLKREIRLTARLIELGSKVCIFAAPVMSSLPLRKMAVKPVRRTGKHRRQAD